METTKGWSLATVVAFHCTWIVALFMGAYGTVEVWVSGGSVVTTFLRHTAHVVMIFGGFVSILHFVLRRHVSRPITQIKAQLYRLGAGAAEFQPIGTNIRELRQIIDGIGLMRQRMYTGESGAAMREAELALREIRDRAKSLHPENPRASQAILDSVVRVGETLGALR